MFERYISSGDTILVPVQLHHIVDQSFIAEYLSRLARILSMKVRLIHVLDHSLLETQKKAYESASSFQGLEISFLKKKRMEALSQLEEFVEFFEEDIDCSYSLKEGAVIEKILEEAKDTAISLMLVPFVAPSVAQMWMDGLSTPFTLMALSPVAVLMLRNDAPMLSEETSLVFADDLKPSTAASLNQCVELKSLIPEIEIHHIHVADVDEGQLKRAIAQVELQMPAGGAALCVEDVLQNTCMLLEEKLSSRLDQAMFLPRLMSRKWIHKVLVGSLNDQLALYVNHTDPDFVVFGRNPALLHRPFSVGRLPYRFLLGQNRAVLMVPSH